MTEPPHSDKQKPLSGRYHRCAWVSLSASLPSQSRRGVTAPPKGEPLASRFWSCWTP